MFTLQIIENDKSFSKTLVQEFQNIEKFKIINVSHNGKDGLEKMEEQLPDILLLNHIMPELDGFSVLEKMTKLKLSKQPKIFFMTSFPTPEVIEWSKRYQISYLFVKPMEIQNFIHVMKNISLNLEEHSNAVDDFQIETANLNLLQDIGIPTHTKGYIYLKEAILITYFNHEAITLVTKNIYPVISKKYNTTSSCTERAIRHSIKLAWERNNLLFQKKLAYMRNKKPTNGEFISLVSQKLYFSKQNYQKNL